MPVRPDCAPLTPRERWLIQRRTGDEAVERAYRLLHGIAFVLVPIFWLAYRHVEPDTFDPLGVRLVLALISVVMLGLSFANSWVRRHFVPLSHGVVYLLTFWILVLTVVNGFPANYAVGYYFLITVGGIAIGLSGGTAWPLVSYFTGTLGVTTVAMLAGPEPEVDEAVFFFSVLGTALVVIIVLRSRAQAHEALRSSEAHLSEALRIARLGNWEWNVATGRMWWSAEAIALFGWEDGSNDWEAFLALLPPSDQQRIERWQMNEGSETFPEFLSIPLQDGTTRILASKVEVIKGESGLPRYVLGTCLDVTEQKQHEAVLVAAKDKAEEMSRLKDAFLANMSHEIRTPLTAVIGFAEVLAEEVGPDYESLSEPIIEGGQRLLDTLNSVLDLARLEAGEHRLAIEPLDAVEVVKDEVRLLTPLARRKGLALQAHLPPSPAPLLADRAALARILHNLIGNAIKFTENGSIQVFVAWVQERVTITVMDTGVGISAAFLPHLFEEFKQESTGYERSYEGCGLGLSLTKRMVELLGGTIAVESTLGEGSTFTVTLPSAPAPRPESQVGSGDGSVNSSTLGTSVSSSPVRDAQALASPTGSGRTLDQGLLQGMHDIPRAC